MNGGATALLVAGMAVAAVDWVAVATRRRALEYAAKPATLALLIAAAAVLDPAVEGRRRWFLAALVLSLAGDVFLMLPRDRFVAGLGAFLAAHVAYVAGFRVDAGTPGATAAAAVVAVAVGVATARPIVVAVRRRRPELTVPVVAYMAAISAMVATATATGIVTATAGAALFYVSDALIGRRRFVRVEPWMPVAIIVTYHAGQALLVVSLTTRT